jgi:hypothetical protein
VGLTSGALTVLYSPQTSLNGAKLLLNKGPAKRPTIEDMSDAVAAPAIIIPGVTRDGEFTSGLPNKRKRDKDRQDPRKSRRPELPVHGPGRGGRVGASATQHVVQNLVRDTTRDEDVRIILVSIFASAFCVALGNPGVLVPQEIAWFGLSVGCPSTGKCTGSKCLCLQLGGEGTEGTEGRGWRRCIAQQGIRPRRTSQFSRESSWRRNLGTARGFGVRAGIEPCQGPPTPSCLSRILSCHCSDHHTHAASGGPSQVRKSW